MTPTQPTATTTEALRLPEGTLSMQGNDITIAYATREDAERAFDVLEAALSTAPSGDGVPGMVLDDRERMLLGWMLTAFEQSKVGWQITDDLKREMRDANRLVARLSASSAGKETP